MKVLKKEVLEEGRKITISNYGVFWRALRTSPKKKRKVQYVRIAPTGLKKYV